TPPGVRHRFVVCEDRGTRGNRRPVLNENLLRVEVVEDNEVTNLDRSPDVHSSKAVECGSQRGGGTVPRSHEEESRPPPLRKPPAGPSCRRSLEADDLHGTLSGADAAPRKIPLHVFLPPEATIRTRMRPVQRPIAQVILESVGCAGNASNAETSPTVAALLAVMARRFERSRPPVGRTTYRSIESTSAMETMTNEVDTAKGAPGAPYARVIV